jgi:hypothetical protein
LVSWLAGLFISTVPAAAVLASRQRVLGIGQHTQLHHMTMTSDPSHCTLCQEVLCSNLLLWGSLAAASAVLLVSMYYLQFPLDTALLIQLPTTPENSKLYDFFQTHHRGVLGLDQWSQEAGRPGLSLWPGQAEWPAPT